MIYIVEFSPDDRADDCVLFADLDTAKEHVEECMDLVSPQWSETTTEPEAMGYRSWFVDGYGFSITERPVYGVS